MNRNVQKISTTSGALTVSMVHQEYLPVEPWDKRSLLLHLLRHEKLDTTLIFCRTKATVHRVTHYLQDKNISAREIHGDMPQNKRTQVMASMREGRLDVLIASDLAARGLDIAHISHVLNYDLPEDPEVYVHRIGRTARVGRRGIAWSFVTPEEGNLLTQIEKLTGAMIEKKHYPDFRPGPLPSDVADQRRREKERQVNPDASLAERAQPHSRTDIENEEKIRLMFPDGVIPKTAPRRGLGSKFRSRRSK